MVPRLTAAVVMLTLAAGGVQAGMVLAPGDSAPPMQGYPLGGGDTFYVRWDRQTLTLVNFWAAWCAPCRDEMPELERLHREHGSRGLVVVGVHMGPAGEEAGPFLEELQITYPNLQGGYKMARPWGGIGLLPTSYLVSGEGKVLRRYVGASPEQIAALVRDVEDALKGRPLQPMVVPSTQAVTESP